MLLAIDSSAGTSVAVVDPSGGVLAERSVADTRRHAEVIGVLLHEALSKARISADQIAHVVIGMGPGPFTGLRVGIAAGRAFALALQRPVLALPSHDAIAFSAYLNGQVGEIVVATDARRRELYWSTYRGIDSAGAPLRIEGPTVSAPDRVPAAPSRINATEVSAAALGLLAARLLASQHPGGHQGPDSQPLYLRSPDATPFPGKAARVPEER